MKPLPSNLPTMPDPCTGVPANAWCPSGSTTSDLRQNHRPIAGELAVDTYPTNVGVREQRGRIIAE
jgi:hypothetical protein